LSPDKADEHLLKNQRYAQTTRLIVAFAPLPGYILKVHLDQQLNDSNTMRKEQNNMQRITPFLWFDGNAEEAMNFYTSIFKNTEIRSMVRYGEEGPGPKDTVMTASFRLEGQEFVVLNGGPQFKFTEAISFVVNCQTQEEVDEYWEKLSEGGEKRQCGWLKDKFGVSWQVVPTVLNELLQDKDAERSGNVMKAMMQMSKIDIETLEKAYKGQATATY
jgi:predicted 3-demethylubiquinone-9 3-methyltransferase (glyoxalase superfamily)